MGYRRISIRKVYENHTKTYENYMKTIQKQQEINRKSIRGTLGFPVEKHAKIIGKPMKTIWKPYKNIKKSIGNP